MFQFCSVSSFAKVPSLAFSRGHWMLNPRGPSCGNSRPPRPPKKVCYKTMGTLRGSLCLCDVYSREVSGLVDFFLFLKGLCDSSPAIAADGQRAGRDGPWCSVNGILPASCHRTARLWYLFCILSNHLTLKSGV